MEKPSDESLALDEYVALLKSRIPALDHGALDSRLEELLNDPNADAGDAVTILRQEFDPDYDQ